MKLETQINSLLNSANISKKESEISELKALQLTLESCTEIKNFVLSYEDAPNDEGGSYKEVNIVQVNQINTYLNPIYINEDSGNSFIKEITKISNECKANPSTLNSDIKLISNLILKMSDLTDSLFESTINMESIKKHISVRKQDIKNMET